MEKIKIDEIKIKENIRTDYGDLTELTESIRQNGMRQPIILNSDNEIIDGHRRMIAAKAAGLVEVPVFYADDKIDEKTSQMIAGIFQKNLNPVEEGKAFAQYILDFGITTEQLAVRISKRKNYVEKRLEIAKLPVKIQTALIKNKIQIGHALLLARITGETRDELLKEIIDDELGVQETKDHLHYNSMNLKDAPFCKGDCTHCIHNGSKQAELFETGAILSGECLNKKCFNGKMTAFINMKKEEFKDVLFEGDSYSSPDGFVDGSSQWNCTEFKITDAYKAKCKEKGIGFYLVSINDRGRINEFFVMRPKKNEAGEIETPEEVQVEKKGSALLTKVTDFKTQFLINETKENVASGTQGALALGVLRMMQQADWNQREDLAKFAGNLMDNNQDANVENLFKATAPQLENIIARLAKHALRRVSLKELIIVSKNFGVSAEKDFLITEDYLKMYTKDQLDELIVELTLEPYDGSLKKAQIIEHILNQNLAGMVPKVML